MPVASKQVPNRLVKSSVVSHKNGSILSEIIPVRQIKNDYIQIVIYGQNRVGKSYLACQFPKPLLLIAMEPTQTGGARTVKNVDGVDYIRIDSSEKLLELVSELKTVSPFPYKTVVADSATSLQDIILKELLNLPELPVQLGWGTVSEGQYQQRSEICREKLRRVLSLPCHVVVCAKERDHNPPIARKEKNMSRFRSSSTSESFFASDLGGATVGWLNDTCDYVGRLYIEKEIKVVKSQTKVKDKVIETESEIETGRIVRRFRTMYHPNFAAGFRSAHPENVPEWIDDPTFDKIYKVINGERIPTAHYPGSVLKSK